MSRDLGFFLPGSIPAVWTGKCLEGEASKDSHQPQGFACVLPGWPCSTLKFHVRATRKSHNFGGPKMSLTKPGGRFSLHCAEHKTPKELERCRFGHTKLNPDVAPGPRQRGEKHMKAHSANHANAQKMKYGWETQCTLRAMSFRHLIYAQISLARNTSTERLPRSGLRLQLSLPPTPTQCCVLQREGPKLQSTRCGWNELCYPEGVSAKGLNAASH